MKTGELRIKSGRHIGAVVVLNKELTSVGTDPTCDIVLSDDGLAPSHFTLNSTSDGTVVTAQDGMVKIDDDIEVAPGFRAMVNGGMTLTSGDVRMEFTVEAPAPLSRWRSRPKGRAVVPVLICTGLLLVGAQEAGTVSAQLIEITQPDTSHIAVVQTPPAKPPQPIEEQVQDVQSVPASSAEVSHAVATQLVELDLHKLDVRDVAGTVSVSGTLPPASHANWATFQRWFDAQWPGMVLQGDAVVLAAGDDADPAFPIIQSVWSMGSTPYVMIAGTRVRVGNTINDGWTLTAIEGTSVTMRKDGRDWHLDLIDTQPGSLNEG